MSLFDQISAPNLFLLGTSVSGQSAFSHKHDPSMNMDLSDKFSYHFYKFLDGKFGRPYTKDVKLSDMPEYFPFSMLDSDVRIKHTHATKKPEDLYLYEYIPLPRHKIDSGTLHNLDNVELL